jgi:septum formation protein
MGIVLASSSPRRRQLLGLLTQTFTVFTPEVDETPLRGEQPADYAKRVALLKARAAREAAAARGDLVIACDTIVTLEGAIIGKPRDFSHAIEILTALQGRTHHVVSALALTHGALSLCESESTGVRFKTLRRDEIVRYLNSIDYADKAGAYAIQENGSRIIQSIEGSLSNVIGFPMRLLLRMMREHGMMEHFALAEHVRTSN